MFGTNPFFRIFQTRIFGKFITIFCYHDVTNQPSNFSIENNLHVSNNVFEYQVEFIKKNFSVIEPKQLSNNNLPINPALVTFDDGFKSFFTNALPILEKHKIPVIIFLNMGPILGEMFWPGLVIFLSKKRADFKTFLKNKIQPAEVKEPIFLSCTRSTVEEYLENNNDNLRENVLDYVGLFANKNDLEKYCFRDNIYYANHSYMHLVSSLMNEDELIEDFEKNEKILKKYPNYLNFFAFPFGQPETTFTENQVKLLTNNGVKKIFFSAASSLNEFRDQSLLDRITLLSDDNSYSKIRFKICRPWFIDKKRTFFSYFYNH